MDISRAVLKYSCSLFAPTIRSDSLAPFLLWHGKVTCLANEMWIDVCQLQADALGAFALSAISLSPMHFRKQVSRRIHDRSGSCMTMLIIHDYDEQSPCQPTFITEGGWEENYCFVKIPRWGDVGYSRLTWPILTDTSGRINGFSLLRRP